MRPLNPAAPTSLPAVQRGAGQLPAVQRTAGLLPAVQKSDGQLPAVQLPGTLRLRYLAREPLLVRGAVSGSAYRFSQSQQVALVQRADADALLATGQFRREG